MRKIPKPVLVTVMMLALSACGGQEPQTEEAFAGELEDSSFTREPDVDEPASGMEADPRSEAQSEAPTPASEVLVPAGSVLRVVLDESVSTDSHTAGQTFAAHVGSDVPGPNGIAIPQGTKVRGIVRASRESASSDDPATLVLAIESVSLDGEEIALEGSISDAEFEGDRRDSTGQTAGKIAIGTAAGAILGGILGDGDRGDAVRGAIAGAAGGAIVAFTTQDGHASVDEGAVLVVTLESAIVS